MDLRSTQTRFQQEKENRIPVGSKEEEKEMKSKEKEKMTRIPRELGKEKDQSMMRCQRWCSTSTTWLMMWTWWWEKHQDYRASTNSDEIYRKWKLDWVGMEYLYYRKGLEGGKESTSRGGEQDTTSLRDVHLWPSQGWWLARGVRFAVKKITKYPCSCTHRDQDNRSIETEHVGETWTEDPTGGVHSATAWSKH